MRGHFQQIGSQLVDRIHLIIGWMLALIGTTVYLLTLEPNVSFWDCGEFIAVSSLLQIGHPPGAPFYQLLAHMFTLLAGSNTMAVAWWSNALSALAGGLTVMFLYWTVLLLGREMKISRLSLHLGAIVGSLCYLFCDTAWFSAVESEVYSLAMLIAAVLVWSMLRWYHCEDRTQASRWLCLTALLLGLGYCTHQITLLTSPALLLIFIFKIWKIKQSQGALPTSTFLRKVLPLTLLFFVMGLTPYLIIPIRATTNTPINECHSGKYEDVKAYLNRDRYEKAPLYPRMWRHRENDALYAQTWNGGDTNLAGNLQYYASYQLSYMYFRYLMWNFSGRYNDRQGYGSPQNGQFITGIPFFDKLLVGTSATPPDSLHPAAHNRYFLLPLLLGILGLSLLYKRKDAFYTVLTLFLMGGIILSIYLNHPCYEPRERDYAYILSFYAFTISIAFGASRLTQKLSEVAPRLRPASALLLAVPLLMAFQNWDDHDRSHRFIAHDAGANILNTCARDPKGAVLFCYGDNDTFPLWYLQNIEGERLDVQVANIGLIGWHKFANLLEESIEQERPVYFTHYAYNQIHDRFPGRLQLEGTAYRLCSEPCDSVAVEPFLANVMQDLGWHSLDGVYVDEVGCKFLEMYWSDVVLLANNLSDQGRGGDAYLALDKTLSEIPLRHLQDPKLMYSIAEAYEKSGDTLGAERLFGQLDTIITEQLAYFHTMSQRRQRVMPYTLGPRQEVSQMLRERKAE